MSQVHHSHHNQSGGGSQETVYGSLTSPQESKVTRWHVAVVVLAGALIVASVLFGTNDDASTSRYSADLSESVSR